MAGTMKALVTKGDKTAHVKEIPIPKPGPGEILVKVHYVAQNPTDWKSTAGAKEAGRVVGCDFAGSVADPNGSPLREGQRVAGWVFGCSPDPPRGAFAQYLVTEASMVFPVPDSVTDPQAAVVPLAVATVVQALFQRLALPPPEEAEEEELKEGSASRREPIPLLINGGTSSVGMYAVQLAKKAGLRVIATGSRRNHDLLRGLGADVVVDYRDADWVEQVRKAAGGSGSGGGLQYAFDCISEVETTRAVAQAISPEGGHVMCILPRKADEVGAPPHVRVESTLAYTVFGRPLVYGAFDNLTGDRSRDKALWEKYLRLLPRWLEEGYVKPNPQRELGGLEDIPKGFELQEKGGVSAEKLVYKIA